MNIKATINKLQKALIQRGKGLKMDNNFKCKAEKSGYCNQWLRECVSWNNCNLESYGAPCPGCVASSPLDNEQCNGCEYQTWKKENYCE